MIDLVGIAAPTLSSGTPCITKDYSSDLGDNPADHRWRAWWLYDNGRGPASIVLAAYPVVKNTPCGVRVDEFAYREATRDGVVWRLSGSEGRLLLAGANAAWAKPTQEEAMHSLAIRLGRWAGHLSTQRDRMISAAEGLRLLRPAMSARAEYALNQARSSR